MEFEEECLKIIDTPEFQRLRSLKQLGVCSYVFPSANHTRFEHSLGVAHISEKMIKNIKNNQPELNISDRDILIVKIAGLIHDLGHGCFSHFFDILFLGDIENENKDHEVRSIKIFEKIVKKYKINITNSEINIIKNIINPTPENNDFMYHIVANHFNNLDTDKFDYLLRDTKLLGLPYSIDCSRILMQSHVINNKLCYPSKEIYTIYEIFHTRYRLHKQIYTHPCVQQIEYMLLDVLNLADKVLNIRDSINNLDNFNLINDNIIDIINFMNDDRLYEAKQIIKNIKNRKLYSFIGEYIYNNSNIIKISKQEFIDYDDRICEKDIIIHKMRIGYTSSSSNPVDSILFYDLKDKSKAFNCNKNNISKLLPDNFQENIIRIFCRNPNKNDIIKKAFNGILEKYN